jgi:hypothetical protein
VMLRRLMLLAGVVALAATAVLLAWPDAEEWAPESFPSPYLRLVSSEARVVAYEIERAVVEGTGGVVGTFEKVGVVYPEPGVSAFRFTDDSVVNGVTYRYRVVPVYADGRPPEQPGVMSRELTPLAPPQLVTVAAPVRDTGPSTFQVLSPEWLPVTGAASYTVLYRERGTDGAFVPLPERVLASAQRSCGEGTRHCVDVRLPAGRTYDFQVFASPAVDAGRDRSGVSVVRGNSLWGAPEVPTLTLVGVNGRSPQLSWGAPSPSVQNMVLEHSTDNGQTWRAVPPGGGCGRLQELPSRSCVESRSLAGGVNHLYRLRVSNPVFEAVGVQTVSAMVVGAVTVSVPQGQLFHDSATLEWRAPGADQYEVFLLSPNAVWSCSPGPLGCPDPLPPGVDRVAGPGNFLSAKLENSATLGNLTASNTYRFVVVAVNPVSGSGGVFQGSFTTLPAPVSGGGTGNGTGDGTSGGTGGGTGGATTCRRVCEKTYYEYKCGVSVVYENVQTCSTKPAVTRQQCTGPGSVEYAPGLWAWQPKVCRTVTVTPARSVCTWDMVSTYTQNYCIARGLDSCRDVCS